MSVSLLNFRIAFRIRERMAGKHMPWPSVAAMYRAVEDGCLCIWDEVRL